MKAKIRSNKKGGGNLLSSLILIAIVAVAASGTFFKKGKGPDDLNLLETTQKTGSLILESTKEVNSTFAPIE